MCPGGARGAAAIEAAKSFAGPLIVKPNRGGKGLGVRLFADPTAACDYLENGAFEPSVDGITLLQAYVEPPEPCITRMEFVGGRFFYAVRVDTSEGFELTTSRRSLWCQPRPTARYLSSAGANARQRRSRFR